MRLQAVSLGPEVDVWRPQEGVVHSTFERAVNLLMGSELWAVLASARQDTPFGIRLAPGVCRIDVKVADRVHVRAGYTAIGRLIVDCRTASRWVPAPWTAPCIGLDARLVTVEAAARARAWPGSSRIAADVTAALDKDAPGSEEALGSVVRRCVGLGPGLTPAGDDVLVGILAVLTSASAGDAGIRAAGRLADALAPVLCLTADVSRHLVDQALRGMPGRALHDLGKALIEGAPQDVRADALDRVLDTGGTSGADACLGLVAACRLEFSRRRAAA